MAAKVSGTLAKEYVEKFPDIGTYKLGKKAYRENISVWPTLKACIAAISRYREVSGGATTTRPKPIPAKPKPPMRSCRTKQGDVVFDYLARFPNAAVRTLASKAFKENKGLWKTEASCCTSFNHYRGTAGNERRQALSDTTHVRSPRRCSPGGFAALPEGIVELTDWQNVQVDTPGRWLVMSDIHLPYHDKQALGAIWKLAQEQKVRGVLLNGDIADCHAISRWQTDPRERDFANELDVLRQFFAAIRADFKKADIIWKWGNHEERYDNYMQLKAPEMLDVAEFNYGNLSHAEKYGIRIVKDKQPIKLGKLWTLHGHEYRGGFTSPVNPARGLYNKSKLSCIAGHLHQASEHSEPDLGGHVTSCWTTGCLCDRRPRYAVINKWTLGAAIVEVSKDGAYGVNNYRIIDGKCWS